MARSNDLLGKIAVVTGGTSGIGHEIAKYLALHRAEIVLPVRDEQRGRAARDAIVSDTCNERVHVFLMDCALVKSIDAFVEQFGRRFDKLDILINNAAVWLDRREETKEGLERVFATNVLAYFHLTNALLPYLERGDHARVVNVASELAHSLDVSDLEWKRRPFDGKAAYAQSKQANRMLTWALDRRLEGKAVYANAVHPGFVNTGLFRSLEGMWGKLARTAARWVARSPEQGAETAIYVATHSDFFRSRGNYVVNKRIRRCKFRNEALEDALWSACEEAVERARKSAG